MRIEVKAKAGRVARTSPQGPFIPEDRYVVVEKTSYIERLLNVHGDIEAKPQGQKPPVAPAPKPLKPAAPEAENEEIS